MLLFYYLRREHGTYIVFDTDYGEIYMTCWLGKDEHLQFNHCKENLQILLEYL